MENKFIDEMRMQQFFTKVVKDVNDGIGQKIDTGNSYSLLQTNALHGISSKLSDISLDISDNFSALLTTQDKMLKVIVSSTNDMALAASNSKKNSGGLAKSISEAIRKSQPKEKKDNMKRVNYDEQNSGTLDSIARSMGNMDKRDKKKGMGMASKGLMAFGGLLAIGGVLGFLLTGKKVMLNNVVKGFAYGTKGITMALKGVFGFVKNITKVIKGAGAIFKGAGSVAKLTTKTAGKQGLKKIPGIGTIAGIVFGVKKFADGDYVGGLLEFGSALALMIPGFGIPIAIAIDLYTFKRDLTLTKEERVEESKVWKTIGKAGLKLTPGIGTLMWIMDGIKKWKSGDKLGGLKDMSMGLLVLVPGMGPIIGIAQSLLAIGSGFKAIGKAKEHKQQTVKGATQLASFKKSKTKNKLNNLGKIGGAQKAWKAKRESLGLSSSSMLDPNSGYDEALTEFMQNNYPDALLHSDPEADANSISVLARKKSIGADGIPLSIEGMSVADLGGEYSDTASYYKNDGVNVNGMRGDVWNNLHGMFDEFNMLMNEQHPGHKNRWNMDGSRVQINSGFRSISKQKKLWDKYIASGKKGTPAAEPGKSMHNYGYAMDINSPEANIMGGNGKVKLKVQGHKDLLSKWGFQRPVKGEPWHLEPKKLDYAKVRAGITNSADGAVGGGRHSDPEGDALPNVPTPKLDAKVKQQDKPIMVALSKEDMTTLAQLISDKSKPMPKAQVATSPNTGDARE